MKSTPSSQEPSNSRATQRAREAQAIQRELRLFLEHSWNEKPEDYAKHDAAWGALEKEPYSYIAQRNAYGAALNFARLQHKRLKELVAKVETLPADFGVGPVAKHFLLWSRILDKRPSPDERLVLTPAVEAELMHACLRLSAYRRTERQLRRALATGLLAAQSLEIAASQAALLTEDVLNADRLSEEELPHAEHIAVCDIVVPAFATLCHLVQNAHDLDSVLHTQDISELAFQAEWFVKSLKLTAAQQEQDPERTRLELIARAKASAKAPLSSSESTSFDHGANSSSTASAYASTEFSSTSPEWSDDSSYTPSYASYGPAVNPANGFPMLDGGAIDVGGNIYGITGD